MTPTTPHQTTLAYSVPAFYINNASYTYINGVFRVAFFKQNLTPQGDGSAAEVLVPRFAVVMVPGVAEEFLREFRSLFEAIARAAQVSAATMHEEHGTSQ